MNGSQENDHVKAIAEFAIAAVEAAGRILIDEDDPKRGYVRIRVGFHSGPVVSNVIGSLNPRVGYAGQVYSWSCFFMLATSSGQICSVSLTHALLS